MLPLSQQTINNITATTVVSNGMVNLFWPGTSLMAYPAGVGPLGNNLTSPSNPYLGSTPGGAVGGGTSDNGQHPYWRSEEMQRLMNLTTVRTHQYAVWITIGFFRSSGKVISAWLQSNFPWLAYDILGPEKGPWTAPTSAFAASSWSIACG